MITALQRSHVRGAVPGKAHEPVYGGGREISEPRRPRRGQALGSQEGSGDGLRLHRPRGEAPTKPQARAHGPRVLREQRPIGPVAGQSLPWD